MLLAKEAGKSSLSDEPSRATRLSAQCKLLFLLLLCLVALHELCFTWCHEFFFPRREEV